MAPRELADPIAVSARRALLSQPHVAPLNTYVARLRERGLGEVPDFDPLDGGTNALVLFLFEKPGPMTRTSGFISRDNDDPTAEATHRFMSEAGLRRSHTIVWNAIPWWNGTRRITPTERREGAAELEALLSLLPEVRSVVLVGKQAQRLSRKIEARELRVIHSPHPSPIVRGTRPEVWASIPSTWASAVGTRSQVVRQFTPPRKGQ